METIVDELYTTSRTVVLWFVEDGFGKNTEREHAALKEALDYIGIRTKVTKNKELKAVQKKYQAFIPKLNETLSQVVIDTSDGLEQEIEEVGEILKTLRTEYIKERAKNITKKFF